MLPFGVTIPATVTQRSEIPEGLMNYPVYVPLIFEVLYFYCLFIYGLTKQSLAQITYISEF
jgi:hypothetical protein